MQGANAPSQMKSTKILWPLAILGSPHQGGRTSVVLLKTALSCSRRRCPAQDGARLEKDESDLHVKPSWQ